MHWLESNRKAWNMRYGAIPTDVPFSLQFLTAKNGDITAKTLVQDKELYLHSAYQPVVEAKRFITGQDLETGDHAVVFGFSLGYHIVAALEQLGPEGRVVVIEPNVGLFHRVMEHVDCASILANPRVTLIVSDQAGQIQRALKEAVRQKTAVKTIVHPASVTVLPSTANSLKDWLEEIQMRRYMDISFSDVLQDNVQSNLKHIERASSLDSYWGQFTNTPICVIGAGPSLDRNIHLLQDFQKHAVLISVATALAPLQEYGVSPHFVVTTDPYPSAWSQLAGAKKQDVPLIFLPTVHPQVLNQYQGPKIVAFQQDFDIAEQMAQSLGRSTIRTGGSVATAALDIALRMGGSPIILIGLDFAFTDMATHTSKALSRKQVDSSQLLRVPGNIEKTVPTQKNLYFYLRWMERRIAEERGNIFYNCTQGGAFIKGTIQRTLQEVMDLYT